MAASVLVTRSLAASPVVGIRGTHQPFHVEVRMFAGDDDAAARELLAAKTGYTIFLTRVVFSITTSAAQAITLHDSASTPVQLVACPASPGVGVRDMLLGEDGIGATESKALQATYTKGNAGILSIEGYYKQTATIAASAAL